MARSRAPVSWNCSAALPSRIPNLPSLPSLQPAVTAASRVPLEMQSLQTKHCGNFQDWYACPSHEAPESDKSRHSIPRYKSDPLSKPLKQLMFWLQAAVTHMRRSVVLGQAPRLVGGLDVAADTMELVRVWVILGPSIQRSSESNTSPYRFVQAHLALARSRFWVFKGPGRYRKFFLHGAARSCQVAEFSTCEGVRR